jgi:hypothetical protein
MFWHLLDASPAKRGIDSLVSGYATTHALHNKKSPLQWRRNPRMLIQRDPMQLRLRRKRERDSESSPRLMM